MPIQETIISPGEANSNPGFNRFHPIPTVKNIKERYLQGISLIDPSGKPIKKSAIQFFIDAAISFLENELEVTIVPTQFINEHHDYRWEEYAAWCFLTLRHKPVISVDELVLSIEKDGHEVVIPNAWIRLSHGTGQIQIAPTSGAIGDFNLSNVSFLPRVMMFNPDWPQFFRFKYTAGFQFDQLPAMLVNQIGKMAAIDVLNVAGNYILGPGIASTSISMDGLSQNVSSTASATSQAFGALIDRYAKDIKNGLDSLRRTYNKKVKVVLV